MGTVISRGRYGGTEAQIIENDMLRCVCLPKHGGKLASLYHKEKAFELLFQSPSGGFRKASPGSAFGDFEACGFDDAFPNIDAGIVATERGNIQYFDHGEIWTAEFEYAQWQNTLQLTYRSPFLGYHYDKLLSLTEDTLRAEYIIRNESDTAFPCIWTCHCLVNYRPDMRMIFPKGTDRVMTVMDTETLGSAGTIYQFPIDSTAGGKLYNFTGVPQADGKTMLKYYCCEESREGCCGYRYPSDGMEAVMRYDEQTLPYLGFWITAGGFRGDLNCALEPTNGYYDSIETARCNGKCPCLAPGDEMRFCLEISLYAV